MNLTGIVRVVRGKMTFFIRTFFFVYMGMIITFKQQDLNFYLTCFSILLIIIVMRYVSVGLTALVFKEKKQDRFIMMSMLPRGLATAVLAIIPASLNMRGSENFVDITFAIIIMTNVIMTLGVYSVDKVMKKAK